MNVLITGITGFAGSHLAEYILNMPEDIRVFGTRRYRSRMENIIPGTEGRVTWIDDVDWTDYKAVRKAIEISLPDRVFHLSAKSFVPESWDNPQAVLHNNIQSQQNIFEALRDVYKGQHNTRVQIACSSEEYGHVLPNECPISEFNELRPMSPYAVSKVAQDFGGLQEYMTHKTCVVRTRAFNHTGPRRGDVFVVSAFAKQVAEIEAGLHDDDTVWVGNLEAVRDFTDVRDMVRAYWLASEHCEPTTWNIGTGEGHAMEQILQRLISMSTVNNIYVENDPKKMRPSDVPRLICDSTRFREKTGWTPEFEIEETLQDTLNYWRERI